jgi:hypothetical protein
MRHPRLLIAALALAALLLIGGTQTVFAECFPGSLPRMANDPLIVGTAFLATVTEASANVDPNPNGHAYDWHIVLAIEATYVGSVPKTLVLNEWSDGSCDDFKGSALRTGDRIILAAEDLKYRRGAPLEGHHMVLWKQTGQVWSFFADALTYGAEPGAYPKVARDADTKAEILRAIYAGAMPGTSTDPGATDSVQPKPTLLAVTAVAATFALLSYLFGSRRRRAPLA